jgi:hypothetical protein
MPNTIGINGEECIKRGSMPEFKPRPLVIIRTYSAGVHIGEYDQAEWKKEGQVITLKNARRLWRWRGANTLSEVAIHGVNREEFTRISESVEEISLVPIEIIPVAERLRLRLR